MSERQAPYRVHLDPLTPLDVLPPDDGDDFTKSTVALVSIAASLQSIAASLTVLAGDVVERRDGTRAAALAEYRRVRTANVQAFKASESATRTLDRQGISESERNDAVERLHNACARMDATSEQIDALLVLHPWLKDVQP